MSYQCNMCHVEHKTGELCKKSNEIKTGGENLIAVLTNITKSIDGLKNICEMLSKRIDKLERK